MTKPSSPPLFTTFVMSLTSAAFIELGVIEDPHHPQGQEKKLDIESARAHIDILSMLQDKTRGNLSSEEKDLLDRVLTDLKLQFAKIAGGQKK